MIEYYSQLIKNRDTSYKLFMMKYLFESIYKNKTSFSFKEISCGIVSFSWNVINDKAERFTFHDKLIDLFEYINDNYDSVDNYSSQNEVYDFLINSTDKFIKKSLSNIVAYVPYRLLIDNEVAKILSGQIDRKKNGIIAEYSIRNADCLYSINGKNIIVRDAYIRDVKNNYFYLNNWIDEIIKKELR